MVLQAASRAEHKFWVKNLVSLCVNAIYKGSTLTGSNSLMSIPCTCFILLTAILADEYNRILADRIPSGRNQRDNKDSQKDDIKRDQTDSLEMLRFSTQRADGEELGPPPSVSRSRKEKSEERSSDVRRSGSREREDHRITDQHFSRGGGGPSSSARISGHIAGNRPSYVSIALFFIIFTFI